MMNKSISQAKVAAVFLMCAANWLFGSIHPAAAQDAKSIDLIIGYAAGGGYDAYGRLVARHLGQHLPGHPIVLPRNMPGAGSLTAANYVFNQAPKDGTAIGLVT